MAEATTWLVVGDSISAAYGLEMQQGWVALLEERLEEAGHELQLINASISGDTTAGGVHRLPALLEAHQPHWVIIELGGNDGLRGLPLAQLQHNLTAMVQLSREHGAQVVLLGMRIPPNYGDAYAEGFFQTYAKVSEQEQVLLLPFFLHKVAGEPGMMQEDGIHPTAAAQPQLVENFWPLVEKMLTSQGEGRD